jgi:hypothetical protein
MKILHRTGGCAKRNIDALEERATCMTVTFIQVLKTLTDLLNSHIRSIIGASQSICYKLVINDATKVEAG